MAMKTEPLSALDPDRVDADHSAIFLDFDGTLVEIADRPDLVRLSPETHLALNKLHAALGGALAVVTGRDIGDVDRFLAPLHLPVAGVHGLKRRSTDGSVHGTNVDGHAISLLKDRLRDFTSGAEGLLIERKSGSVALHYRARPDLEGACIEAMDEAVHGIEGIHLLRGKMVIEAKAKAGDKGRAVKDFLAEPPFSGRTPLFAGDDVTDEDAFAAVNAREGISVKVGPGPTQARYRATDITEFLGWLKRVADNLARA